MALGFAIVAVFIMGVVATIVATVGEQMKPQDPALADPPLYYEYPLPPFPMAQLQPPQLQPPQLRRPPPQSQSLPPQSEEDHGTDPGPDIGPSQLWQDFDQYDDRSEPSYHGEDDFDPDMDGTVSFYNVLIVDYSILVINCSSFEFVLLIVWLLLTYCFVYCW